MEIKQLPPVKSTQRCTICDGLQVIAGVELGLATIDNDVVRVTLNESRYHISLTELGQLFGMKLIEWSK